MVERWNFLFGWPNLASANCQFSGSVRSFSSNSSAKLWTASYLRIEEAHLWGIRSGKWWKLKILNTWYASHRYNMWPSWTSPFLTKGNQKSIRLVFVRHNHDSLKIFMQRQRPIDRHNHVCPCVCVCDYKFFMNLQRLPWASPHFGLSTFVVRYVCCLWVKLIYFIYMDGNGCTAASWRFMSTGTHEERWCGGASLQGIERAWFLKLFWPTKAGGRFVIGWWNTPWN